MTSNLLIGAEPLACNMPFMQQEQEETRGLTQKVASVREVDLILHTKVAICILLFPQETVSKQKNSTVKRCSPTLHARH